MGVGGSCLLVSELMAKNCSVVIVEPVATARGSELEGWVCAMSISQFFG